MITQRFTPFVSVTLVMDWTILLELTSQKLELVLTYEIHLLVTRQ